MNRNKCRCPSTREDVGFVAVTTVHHTVACGQFEGPVYCTGPNCTAVRGKVNHWFLVAVTRTAAFVCTPLTKGNAGRLSRRYPHIPLNPVCGFGCAQKLFEQYMHGERGKTFSHNIDSYDRIREPHPDAATPAITSTLNIITLDAILNYLATPEEREAQSRALSTDTEQEKS